MENAKICISACSLRRNLQTASKQCRLLLCEARITAKPPFDQLFLQFIIKSCCILITSLCRFFLIQERSEKVPSKQQNPQTHRAAVVQNSVSETAVSLCLDLQVIGPFQNHSFFQVLRLVIHVPNTVSTKVGDVLGSFLGQEAQECHLSDSCIPVHKLWR